MGIHCIILYLLYVFKFFQNKNVRREKTMVLLTDI